MSGYASVAIASVVIPIKHGEELWVGLGTGNPNPNYPLFTFAFNLHLKLGIDDIGIGNTIILATFPLYRRIYSVILGNKVGNTTDPVLVMGENRGGYGCKDCLYRV